MSAVGKSAAGGRALKPSRSTERRSGWSHGDKKEPLRLGPNRPYRKPTQVGWMSILRRAGELALRNSANCTRNFGRSVASCGSAMVYGRLQSPGPGDCLPKTQVSANS